MSAGAKGFAAFLPALLKVIWIDGLYAVPTDKLNPSEPYALATELYPDITFTSVEDFFKTQV